MSSKLSASNNATYEIGPSSATQRIGGKAARFIRLLPVLLSAMVGACQSAAVQSRQSFQPTLSADVRQQPIRGGGSRLRVGSYSVAGLRASVAERRWPLMDGYSVSHRYEFDLAADEGQRQQVRCVLITVRGDENRDGRSLHCTVRGEDSWEVELSGRSSLDGMLVGTSREYQLTRTIPENLTAGSGADAAADYYVLAGAVLVATVPAENAGEAWIAPELEQRDRAAVAATVIALLVGRDLGRGGM